MQATLAPNSDAFQSQCSTDNIMEKKEARKGFREREKREKQNKTEYLLRCDISLINTSDFLGYFTLLVE